MLLCFYVYLIVFNTKYHLLKTVDNTEDPLSSSLNVLVISIKTSHAISDIFADFLSWTNSKITLTT